ncbi:hypothetical protein [Lactobacillus delbrueckii]|uniref:Uncharacterized protein n=1 Tax=Lactobacillus delbrueckii subsp. bulgaricus TaxID=1585 RepID=A0AAV5PC22_LACDE|nr:hypothetical protein [Lactobacillus delbrueckii]ADY85620.1 Hypothetical conserved protein [Lactobacillus delbrueckii subsp. bulgaricus 2038]ALT48012.1 hypothetical protein AT236_01637 [Lactobacillus delbrueckii subsp. bulgaricus]AQR54534.1 hypothetical protein BBD26_1307 [Lactobacillus delbrueckii subsp. bulgaricus]AXI15541.1 hypothetical protein BC336_1482 [Lactobacillus delbrueckii subsp. bulgaricus]KIY25169.1 hypothetical protein SB57_00960 [Lactobacillus delbrueckii subsp. bulgaricus]
MKELGKKQITIKLLGDDTDDAKKTTEFIQSALESRLAKPVRPLSPLGPTTAASLKTGSATGLPSRTAWTPPTPSTNPSAWLNWKKAWPSTLKRFTN